MALEWNSSPRFSIFKVKTGANIFATSRYIPEIMERFSDEKSIEIRAAKEDVLQYLGDNMSQLPVFVTHDSHLQEEIKTKIIRAAGGMFVNPITLIELCLIL